MSAIAYEQKPNLAGWHFRVERHDCEWTVVSYARGGNWNCSEPRFGTECQFHFTEIIRGAVPPWAPIEIERARDWQVLALVPCGAIEVDCNSGEKRLVTHADEKQSQKQAGEYREEDWDE